MSHIVQPTRQDAGQDETVVSDDTTQGLLMRILKELKILNLHMSLMSDEDISQEDVEI